MVKLTDEQKLDIENKETYEIEKAELLKVYKSYAEDLEYANDTLEESWINEKREKLAVKIKSLAAKLREIEKLQA